MNDPHSLAREIAAILERRAAKDRDEAPIFYNDLASELRLPKVTEAWNSHPLCPAFEILDQEDCANKRPLRTALVISRENGIPGPGFFKTLSRLRNSKPVTNFNDQVSVWSEEFEALTKFYRQI